ncbi:MAG: hypothetical protein ABI585_10895 [Betaproteobacteria bacterium]
MAPCTAPLRPTSRAGWRAFITALAAAPLLSGCILERVLETHRQLCDASPPEVAVVEGPDRALKLVFSRPTLTLDDIGWLIGVKPTRVERRGDEIVWIYSAAPSARPASESETMISELRFRNEGGTHKLYESVPPPRMGPLMSRDLIARAIAAACRPQISLSPPGARFDITGLPPGTLPDEARVTGMLGPPHRRALDPESIEYRYCLLPCGDDASTVARFRYEFSASRRLQRAEFAYFRYLLTVDVEAGTATISLRL